jgi:hypothetical protein
MWFLDLASAWKGTRKQTLRQEPIKDRPRYSVSATYRLLRKTPHWENEEKALRSVLNGTADANIAFKDLCNLLKRLGFVERIREDISYSRD